MAERRALGTAMAMTPEKLAFIQTGRLETASSSNSLVATPATPLDQTVAPHPSSSKPNRSKPKRPHPTTSADEGVAREQTPQESEIYGQVLVPVTTRLQPRTAAALRRACLEQKLACRSPNTHQEIVEAAVSQWLADREFLR